MYIYFVILLSMALMVFSVISVVKNFLIQFNVSDNGWKTILIVVLLIISLTCGLFSYIEAFGIREIKLMQPSPQYSKGTIEQLKLLIPIKTFNMTRALCIGCAAYILHMLLIRNIMEVRRKAAEAYIPYRLTPKA